MRKHQPEMPADMLTGARNLFDGMPAVVDDDIANRFFENIIFVGLYGFPLDHEFSEEYGLKEEDDDMDIDGGLLFEEELANQIVVVAKPKHKRKRMNAYTPVEDKLLCECWRDIRQDPKIGVEEKWSALWTRVHPLEAFKVQHDGKAFHLAHCWTIINGEEKFKVQYAGLLARGGKEVVQDHGDGEKARLRGKTNSKKENRRGTTSIALLEQVEGMRSKKDLRKEKRRQEKEEKMHAFMEIQRRRLEMDAERQAKMLELEEAKQAKMLEIEATNARTKAKEVALASMKPGAEIVKVDLNTVSLRKRLRFVNMQAEMLKFDQL
ncbi:Eyes absent-like protein 4 [Hordeum vulgare]|nr:Eyes absent-like protein 4 [Hordeum vulgare]